jgi:uncharacterized repeat protein (TIGR01451 family)
VSRAMFVCAAVLVACGAFAVPSLAPGGAATQNFTFTTVANVANIPYTTPAAPSRIMVVALHMNIAASTGTTALSMYYGDSVLTLGSAISSGGGPVVRTEVWYLVGPAVGTQTLRIQLQNVTANVDTVVGITTFQDVDQINIGTVATTAAGNNNAPTSNIPSAAGRLVIDYMTSREANPLVTAAVGAGQTAAYNANTGAATTAVLGVSSTKASAATVTMSYTLSSAQRWAKVGGDLLPANTDLTVTGYASPDLVDGTPTNVTFTYVVKSTSAGAGGVNFSAALPASLTIVSASTTQGSCIPAATTTCNIGTLLSDGSSATINIVATTGGGAVATTYTLVGNVTTTTPQANTANDSATVVVKTENHLCSNPGKDGVGGTITGPVNTYYPGTGNPAAGTAGVTITLGAVPAGYGATAIAVGDLVLIMQMQDSTININNDDRYGDGAGLGGTGTPGSGSSNLNGAGRYEYVVAKSAVPVTGGGLTFTGAGVNNGLIYGYTTAAATGTQGARRYQVIRVPQYTTATLAAGTTAPAWNGSVGGVLAIDASGTVTMGSGTGAGTLATTTGSPSVTGTGTSFTTQVHAGDSITITGQGAYTVLHVESNTSITLESNATATAGAATYTLPQVSVSGIGFRGGAGRGLGGDTGANTDYFTTSAINTNAMKGEGIAGTPQFVFDGTGTPFDTGADGVPAGSGGRGAPGNAGGGGTDGNPAANDQNSGGGGGGNAGVGGGGGNGWSTGTPSGGFGGTFEAPSTTRMIMGGGGGAGTTNNSTEFGAPNLGANGIHSSGGAGGGIVIIRANQISGNGTMAANGASTLNTLNDSTGGGGAGGTVVIQTQYGTLTGLTITARGGDGGGAWTNHANPAAPGDYPGERHGPGGGGGGGTIYLSSAAGSTNVTGGVNGVTTTALATFGASPGQPGFVSSPLGILAGADATFSCAIADLAVTNVASPNPVVAGSNITLTQTVTNNGPNYADQVTFTSPIPASTTFQSMAAPPPGWTCITPAVGSDGNITCTTSGLASGASASFSIVVQALITTPPGYLLSDTDTVSSLTNDSNYANNTAMATVDVTDATHADLITTVSVPATSVVNANFVATQTVKNGGAGSAANPTFTENTPPNTTFQGITPPAGWTCIIPAIGGTGSISCSSPNPIPSGTSLSFPLTLHVNTGTASGTPITVTATSGTTSNDPYLPNNTASATTTVVTAGSADWAATVTALNDPSASGGFVSFNEVVTNNGPATTTASFTQNTPVNTTFASMATPAGWTCVTPAVGATGAITCTTNAAQATGSTTTFTPRYLINTGTAPGTVITDTATVSVTGGPTDAVPGNNTASATSTVRSRTEADLGITKTDSPDPVGAGQMITYILTVVNHGPATATGVTVNDTLNPAFNFISMSPSQGSCSGTSTITCNLGSLAVDATATVQVVVQLTFAFSAPGTISNTATVSGTLSDPVAANNSSTATTTVLAVTLVRLRAFSATQDNKNKVTLSWQTEFEQDNLGFNIWRDANGQHVKVNKGLIAGSALTSKKTDPKAGYSYHFTDKLDSGTFAQYWLEDVDLHGNHTMHGPVSPTPGPTSNAPDSNPLAGMGADGSVIASQDGFGVVRPLTLGKPTKAQYNQQYDLAGDPGLKVYVTHEGWYRVTRASMVAAGYDPGDNPKKISVYVAGIEQEVNIDDGGDGKFDSNDAVEFYGIGLDNASTGARTYWIRGKNDSGDRITLSKNKGGDPVTGSVPFTYSYNDRSIFFPSMISTPEDFQNFFGPAITSEPVTQTLTVGNLDTAYGGNASIEVVAQGGTDNQRTIDFQINGHDIGTVTLTKQELRTVTFTFPHSFLVKGANAFTMQSLSGPDDVSVLAGTKLTYQHLLRADNGALEVTLPGGRAVTVGGFAAGSVRAIDVTDAQNPIELQTTVAASGGGEFAASFTPSGNGPRVVLVTHASRIITATEMQASKPSSINSSKGADLVIVSHSSFLSAASTLKPVREAQGISTMVLDVDDVYDEFNFGIRGPEAIRTMLQTAQKWKNSPRFLLLVGDATYDPRNYQGTNINLDFVPTKLVTTSLMKTASDDWIGDLTGDGVADIAMGRIPVDTPAQATLVFNRLTSRGTPSGPWATNATFITDVSTDFNFAGAAASLVPLLPASWTKSTIDFTNTGGAAVSSAINNGSILVDYIGHGSSEIWGSHNEFFSSDATALTNGNRLPFVVAMTCLNGYFHDLYSTSMAEALLEAPNGGAIAVWASSTLTEPDQQAVMNAEMFRQLFGSSSVTIGEACQRAKSVVNDADVKKSWMLFGDPSMKLR